MKKYVKYFIEFIVIVAGITVSFMVDEWREERRNREETVDLLRKIKSNLLVDSNKMHNVDSILEYKMRLLNSFIKQKGNVPDSNKMKHVWNLFTVDYHDIITEFF